ncbi:MAG: transcription antitermination factor NusB [Bacteroidetes bacterium]|nr:transcription antitermination factor NusB [Bacteroidota bacterium]
MITRRNIRIKVMQLLYSIDTTSDTTAFRNPVQTLDRNFDKTRELFVFLLTNVLAVAKYAERDARHRAAKNVPSEQDLNVNTKIAGNIMLWQILENVSYKIAVEQYKTNLVVDDDITRKLYLQLTETDEYKQYIAIEARGKKEDVAILSLIFNNIMLQSDVFVSYCEDKFANWDDDIEMLLSLLNAYLSRPQSLEMINMLDADKWSFAKLLLNTCLEKKDHLLEYISPKLKNWDVDRIASLDLIILQMGLSELLYFETIPTKVTINEYIDLAKEYSTPQSGQFVNGLLDNLYKELTAAGKIDKVDYRKNK